MRSDWEFPDVALQFTLLEILETPIKASKQNHHFSLAELVGKFHKNGHHTRRFWSLSAA